MFHDLQEGSKENPGVNYRAITELFKISEQRGDEYSIEISVSVLEIYNEQIHDLLVPPAKAKQKKYHPIFISVTQNDMKLNKDLRECMSLISRMSLCSL